MQPKSESTRLEGPDGLVEYRGSNKLENKKAIITGGEYLPPKPIKIRTGF